MGAGAWGSIVKVRENSVQRVSSRDELGVVVDQLRESQPQIHRRDDQDIQRLHGWIHVWRFADRLWPVCCCGYVGDGFDRTGFLTEDAALESLCERQLCELAGWSLVQGAV